MQRFFGALRKLAQCAQYGIVCGVLAMTLWFFKWYLLGFVVRVLWQREERVVLAALHGTVALSTLASFLNAYLRAVLARPGSSALDVEKDAPLHVRFCSSCQHETSDEFEHCPFCDVCVRSMHHHCVFIAQCCGAHNIDYFERFVQSVVFGNLYMFGSVLLSGFAREFLSLSLMSAAIAVMAGGYLCIHVAFSHFIEASTED